MFVFHVFVMEKWIQIDDLHGIAPKSLWFYRQGGKDQTKKGPNIKLGPQGDKKGLGQDPRKDSSMDGGHHLKVPIYS